MTDDDRGREAGAKDAAREAGPTEGPPSLSGERTVPDGDVRPVIQAEPNGVSATNGTVEPAEAAPVAPPEPGEAAPAAAAPAESVPEAPSLASQAPDEVALPTSAVTEVDPPSLEAAVHEPAPPVPSFDASVDAYSDNTEEGVPDLEPKEPEVRGSVAPERRDHSSANLTLEAHGHGHKATFLSLALGALGVVYGDIGTSPLYALKESIHSATHVPGEPATAFHAVARGDLFGIISLMFWSLVMVVTVKYVGFVLRADNKGEGGIFALLALVPHRMRGLGTTKVGVIPTLVVIGAALLYGDGAITPAVSVLAAVEGVLVAAPDFAPAVIPITCLILVGLFALQSRGTEKVGKLFAPVMVVWFTALACLGAFYVAQEPKILQALSPHWAVQYFTHHGIHGFHILGSVVLTVTGGEALYADMGHFGARPIRLVWVFFVLPSLVIGYLGQGALVLLEPDAQLNPFFSMVPKGFATYALVALSTMTTVIASQAMISGAFSITRQAMQLGYFPRVSIKHTAAHTEGQIYIPEINWMIAIACIALVLSFQKSTALAAAYGIAVMGTMTCTSIVFFVVSTFTWGWPMWRTLPLLLLFLMFDLSFLTANLLKFFDGGYAPVLLGAGVVTVMLVWAKGRRLIAEIYAKRVPALEDLMPMLREKMLARVPGSAVFMTSSPKHAPPILVHYVERARSLHQRVFFLTIVMSADEPTIPQDRRWTVHTMEDGFYRVLANYGFMEAPNVPELFVSVTKALELPVDMSEVTYFLGRENVLALHSGNMNLVAEKLFAFLQRNSRTADRYFAIPPRQVVELGMQIDL